LFYVIFFIFLLILLFLSGCIFTTSADFASLTSLKAALSKHALVIADIVYIHSATAFDDYERVAFYPSANHVIHLVVVMHAGDEVKLQISSTSFNTNANYQKVIVKQLKGAWKVCCMFVCACLYCCVFTLNCRITLQRARSTILCGITLAWSKSWRGTILALLSMMKRVKLSGILSVLLLSMIFMSSLALCCVLLLVWAGFMYASVPLLRLLNSSTRIG